MNLCPRCIDVDTAPPIGAIRNARHMVITGWSPVYTSITIQITTSKVYSGEVILEDHSDLLTRDSIREVADGSSQTSIIGLVDYTADD